MLHLLALAGILSISFSAIFVRFAHVSPVTATFFRALDAVPVLSLIWIRTRSQDRRSWHDHRLAFASGLLLAVDLNLWHESIAFVGAGLGTVIPNVQVVFVAFAAYVLYRERPRAGTVVTIAIVMLGVVLTSGLGRSDAYGMHPIIGVTLGVLAGVCYAAFLVMFRAANRSLVPTVGPLLDATLGTVAGAIACVAFDPGFTLAPPWPAPLWLAALALVSQVLGWLLIATALPRLPALETSVLLLVQPVFAIVWGMMLFGERLSTIQWLGSAVVVAGIGVLSAMRGSATQRFTTEVTEGARRFEGNQP